MVGTPSGGCQGRTPGSEAPGGAGAPIAARQDLWYPGKVTSKALNRIREELARENLDGWLLYDFRLIDPSAYRVLGLEPPRAATRRWFCLVPRRGAPRMLLHRVESQQLPSVPGARRHYAAWDEMRRKLSELLHGVERVAMNYSPEAALPAVSRVDAGTIELVRSLGVKVEGAGDLLARVEGVLSPAQRAGHRKAARLLARSVEAAFAKAARGVARGRGGTEHDLRQFLLERFDRLGLAPPGDGPIVAAGTHTAEPHYVPSSRGSARLKEGDLLLIDLWAKLPRPGSVYADSTWVGFLGREVPHPMRRIFSIVAEARDTAIRVIADRTLQGKPLRGCDVDDLTRDVIRRGGYGPFFTHRTGHSIAQEVHASGANLDNLESHDARPLLANSCFSVEPGIYLPGRFGVRSEVNVLLEGRRARVTPEAIQVEIPALLAPRKRWTHPPRLTA